MDGVSWPVIPSVSGQLTPSISGHYGLALTGMPKSNIYNRDVSILESKSTQIEQYDVQSQIEDLIDLEKGRDINRIFSKINSLKSQLTELSTLKCQYAATVNELYEVTIDDSQNGEQISRRALELGIAIQSAQGICQEIEKLEMELAGKYGFLYAKNWAA